MLFDDLDLMISAIKNHSRNGNIIKICDNPLKLRLGFVGAGKLFEIGISSVKRSKSKYSKFFSSHKDKEKLLMYLNNKL